MRVRRWRVPAPGRLAVAAVALAGGAASAAAQPGAPPLTRHERLQRLGAVVDRRLGLTEAQGARLREVSARYARERQALVAREREARQAIRAELPRGEAADQARVRRALDALVAAQQRRAALLEEEQRELAGFLTPTQRAQYLGLQERAFRAAQRVRGARPMGDSPEGSALGPRRGPRQ